MSSWDAAEKWYSGCVGEKGHYYHQAVVLPNALRLLDLPSASSLIDLGCGQGVLARQLPQKLIYCGVDLSKKLVDEAKRTTKRALCSFVVSDASAKKLPVDKHDFDRACFILSLQNMENGEAAIANAARHLQEGGKLLIVLNHPCFRIPRQSAWGVDAAAKLQYRRVNRYLTPMNIPLQINPGKGEKSAIFYSYHHPLSHYSEWLSKRGFVIQNMEEWLSDKKSEGSAARMEDRAREEIPLFLALVAILSKKDSNY